VIADKLRAVHVDGRRARGGSDDRVGSFRFSLSDLKQGGLSNGWVARGARCLTSPPNARRSGTYWGQ